MTPAQKSALKWLRNRNGDGVFEINRQVLVASGDRAPINRATWNRLGEQGMVEFYLDRKRLRVTAAGWAADLARVAESASEWSAE